jgi:hypothetical protein
MSAMCPAFAIITLKRELRLSGTRTLLYFYLGRFGIIGQ